MEEEADKINFIFKDNELIDYVYSEDSDFLLYNNGNLLTDNKEKNIFNEYNKKKILEELDLSNDQLIDLSILLGNDYNKNLKNFGQVKCFKWIKKYNNLENIIKNKEIETNNWLDLNRINMIRNEFKNLDNKIEKKIELKNLLIYNNFDHKNLSKFLEEKNFNVKRIDSILKRFDKFYEI